MNNFLSIEKKIKHSGYRITQQIRIVLDVFREKNTRPVSPADIVAHSRNCGKKIDLVTVYRILDRFETRGIVHRTMMSGKYVLCHDESCCTGSSPTCHHIVSCKYCFRSEEHHCTLEAMPIPVVEGFTLDTHYLEWVGVCSDCAKTQQSLTKIF